MSGPKLSAFELEERRKKELERKQREIAAENAKSMHCIQEAQRLLKTLDRERGCLLQQQRMLIGNAVAFLIRIPIVFR